MSGTSGIGTAPPATLGAPLVEHHGRDHGRAPVASIPFTGTAGQTDLRDRGRHPVRLDRLHLGAQGPRRAPSCRRSTRARARSSSTGRCTTAGTYTFEISGFQGDLGDFTFKVQPVLVSAARGGGLRGRAHRQGLGPPGRRPGHRRVQEPGREQRAAERRRDRQGHRRQPGDQRHGRAHEHGRAGRRRDQRQPRRVGAGDAP